MLENSELFTLARDLAHRKVLSIYLDNRATDPARRHAWRAALVSGLRAAREGIRDAEERAAFDRAAAFLEHPAPPPGGMWGAPGWVAFATADGPVYVGELPRRTHTRVVWRDGPVIAPYLRALKHQRPVIVARLHGRGGEVHRYAQGVLDAVEPLGLAAADDGARAPRGRRGRERPGRGYPAPRSAVTTEIARERQRAAFRRMAGVLAARLTLLAGEDAVILLAGAPERTRVVRELLPRRLADRVAEAQELEGQATSEEIVRAAKRAARAVRARQGRALLSQVLGQAGHRGVAGIPAVQRVLHLGAVDVLLLTPRFLDRERERAEALLHEALGQGASVEVLSGDPGIMLDAAAGGVAARLRFAIHRLLQPTRLATRVSSSPAAS